jgi:hypothetical protein
MDLYYATIYEPTDPHPFATLEEESTMPLHSAVSQRHLTEYHFWYILFAWKGSDGTP